MQLERHKLQEPKRWVWDIPVGSVSVGAFSLLAGVPGALVDVDLAVRAVEALVAVAPEGVLQRDALAIVARVAGAVVDLGTVAT